MISDDIMVITQFAIFLSMVLVQTFVLSTYGDILSDKTAKVGKMAYKSEWYLCGSTEKKIIMFILLRAQKPCFITIYKFGIANRDMFKELLGYIIGLVPFHLDNDTRKFDIILNIFGVILTHHWDPVFVLDGYSAFDKKSYQLLAYLTDLNAPRYAIAAILAPDCTMIMIIIQLNYHFENLGYAIIDIMRQRKKTKISGSLSETNTNVGSIGNLQEAIEVHSKLIKLTERVNMLFHQQIFGKFTSASIVICCTGFVLIVSNDIVQMFQYTTVLMAILMQTYAISIFGDLLTEKSTLLAQLAFESEWYLCDIRDMRIIQFIIMRAQKPCFISIFKFAIVKKEVFKELMTTAYQLLALLRNLYAK
uniref:Odorant receptor n=1 Tax=Culicoides sonorensis TaxID=179676 RepID=A0A336MKY8_CULSO